MIRVGGQPYRRAVHQPTLYRFRDHHGHLLYVGRTCQPRTRIPQHQIRAWWTHVARIDLEHFSTAEALAAAEAEAIVAERPRFNVQLRNGTSRSTFLDDVADAAGEAGWIWNKDLLPALQAKRPEEYGDWNATRLGRN